MHWAFVRLAISLLIGSEVCLVHSSSSQENGVHQHRLNQHVREVKARRERRSLSQSDLKCDPGETKCTYVTALLDFPPYVMNSTKRGFLFEKIIWFVETVCLGMQSADDPPTCCMEPRFVKDADDMLALIKNRTVDLAFPIQADVKDKLKDLPYVTFIRAFVSKGCSLIVNTKQCEAESREQLLTSITSQWPILACIILLSGISGVVIWVLEHRGNKNQFSSSFTSGSPEGFWWAVVSLTTVGYGDKTPKTFLGRMFGIIWILVGAIMLSLFTALFTNAMQAALDGTKCQEIDSKDVGVSIRNTEAQLVAKQYDANIIKFDSIAEMQKQLSSGVIGRVLVDRNTAFHFLDKSGLKRNRQIRLIRYIDYPLDYYMVHVRRESEDLDKPSAPPNLNDTEDMEPKEQVAACGPMLKELSADLVGASKQSAQDQLIPAGLQTASMSNEMEGLFSTGSTMTSLILFWLLGVFLSLLLLGILWEFFTKCSSTIQRRRQLKGSPSLHGHSDKGNLIPLNKNFSMMQNFVEMEKRLRDLTADIQKMKEEFAGTMSANGDALKGKYKEWSDDNNSGENRRSFFGMLNGRSKNPETVL